MTIFMSMMSGTCCTHGGIGSWWRHLKRETTCKPVCKWLDSIKMDFKETGWSAWTESVWLRIETSDQCL